MNLKIKIYLYALEQFFHKSHYTNKLQQRTIKMLVANEEQTTCFARNYDLYTIKLSLTIY